MPSSSTLIFLLSVLLSTISIILSIITLHRTTTLSLPFPPFLPTVNIALPLLTALIYPLTRRLTITIDLRKTIFRLFLPLLSHLPALLPFTLLILSISHATPSPTTSCTARQTWLRMFETKDQNSVRNIQSRLQCCGYASTHDMAWPFPSRNTDARTCERTLGYTVACGQIWQREEQVAAALTAVASLLNWIVIILVISYLPRGDSYVRLPASSAPSQSQSARLIRDRAEGEEEAGEETPLTREQPEHSRVWSEDTEGGR